MKKTALNFLFILLVFCLSVAESGNSTKYRLGVMAGLDNIRAAEKPNFTFNHDWGFLIGLEGRRALLTFSLQSGKNYSDSAASGHFGFFGDKDKARLAFKSMRAGFNLDIRLSPDRRLSPTLGAGLGYMIWKYLDPAADTTVQTVGTKDNTIDFSATELYLSGALGLEMRPSENWAFNLKTSIEHLTGLGTDFSDSANDLRGRTILRAGISVSYIFGVPAARRKSDDEWASSKTWAAADSQSRKSTGKRDSDGDGIGDKDDDCPDTPPGINTDNNGCPLDGDRDGVFDGLDDCPHTPPAARGYVDIFGCPIDSDFDGIPDFLDRCRSGPAGALVDESGCPKDSDGDGVYDGLDDCPHTRAGVQVDRRGCIDVAFLADTMRIYIDYQPGSFEIDDRTKRRLEPMVDNLRILDHVQVLIVGYTDNVGPSEANQTLSQKRANRMRDWLVSKGIATERLTPVGRGETNFIASNQTADGRSKNRRLELIFSE
ncbi:MAG: OmpA family protein [FCB group bacterium]|nr:OmpA family protein [FCB group bacterium]